VPESPQELEWFSKNLIETLPAAVYICDLEAIVVAFNERAVELWGRTPKLGEADEKFCGAHKLYYQNGTFLPHTESPMGTVLRTGVAVRDQEVVIERPDGSRVTVLVNIAPLYDSNGAQIGAVNCFQDLSAQIRSEEERVQLREELRHSQKLKSMGQLVGGVAHDFNNLLTPIIGNLEMLQRRGARDAREQRMTDSALQSAERAKSLVQHLLAFARRQPLQSRAADIADLISGIAELIGSTTGPTIKLVFDIQPDLPPAKVDAHQMEMAILNLSINARDAMPDGGVLTISASSELVGSGHPYKLESGTYIRLSVTDTGAGMDEPTMIQAIEPFFSTKGVGKGTGLGLSMVDGLVAQLGGKLMLSSELGVGTTVALFAPTTTAVIEGAETDFTSAPETNAKGRLLLVDDEQSVRTVTTDMLTELGYGVVEAKSAEEALIVLNHNSHIEGIITDHLMPGMTGIDLAYAVRAKWPKIPVLILSGYAEAQRNAFDMPLLAKPCRLSDLAASTDDLLRVPSKDKQTG
jgi:PAS domain S-box-containing protein